MTKNELLKLQEDVRNAADENITSRDLSDEDLRAGIEEIVRQKAGGRYLTIDERLGIVNGVFQAYRGFGGLLDSILQDEDVTEVMINGPDKIFVERKGRLTKLDKCFESEEELLDVIRLIARKDHKEISTSNPILDTKLGDSRVNIVLKPIAIDSSTVTIRKFSKEPMTMERLIQYKSLTPEIAALLRKLVEARYNIFVAGGTGSGKTTFLNALSNYIPFDERIITIEDSPELNITGVENLVRMATRNATASADENTAITIKDLIKSSLRMRPDRIIVGEVRGVEALDMLQAMNTGHDGSLSTGHANSAQDMISRLETMVLQGTDKFPLPALRQQIASAVEIIIHLSRLRDHSRKTMMISEVLHDLDASGNVQLNPLYVFEEDKEQSTKDRVVGQLVRTKNSMQRTEKLLRAGFSTEGLVLEDEK